MAPSAAFAPSVAMRRPPANSDSLADLAPFRTFTPGNPIASGGWEPEPLAAPRDPDRWVGAAGHLLLRPELILSLFIALVFAELGRLPLLEAPDVHLRKRCRDPVSCRLDCG